MITVDKGFIASFISNQSPTESDASITEHSHVSVLLFQLFLIIIKPLQILYEFYISKKHFLPSKTTEVCQNLTSN